MGAVAPSDLAAALAENPSVLQAWDSLAPSHQSEYLKWIDEAKQPETRAKRVLATVERLTKG